MCNTSWPSMQAAACARDYAAPWPYGWFQFQNGAASDCRAPQNVSNVKTNRDVATIAPPLPRYTGCTSPQSFDGMTPYHKAAWEGSCHQRFPCLSRSACDKDWSAPCPAAWFEFNAGRSCLPATGRRTPLRHGLRLRERKESRKELVARSPRPCVCPAFFVSLFFFANLSAQTEPAHLREERLHRKPPDRLKKHRQLWRCCRSHGQAKVGPPPGLLHPGPGPDAGHQIRPQPTRQPPTRDDQG